MRKNDLAARAVRLLLQFFDVVSQQRREISIFEALMITRARSIKSFFLCLNLKAIRAKQAKVPFLYNVTDMK